MKVNIRVELDGNEFSLEDILAILVRDKEQPVVNIETVQPVEEVEPEDAPPGIVCKECGTSETPQWRGKNTPEGPLCNRCHFRIKRAKKAEEKKSQSETTVTEKESPKETKKVSRQRRRVVAPKRPKKSVKKTVSEPSMKDIGFPFDKDRIVLLRDNGITSVAEVARMSLQDLMQAGGASVHEDIMFENAQRVANALLREYELALKKQPKPEKKTKPVKEAKPQLKKWKDETAFELAWEAIHRREAGVLTLDEVLQPAYEVARNRYESPQNGATDGQIIDAIKSIFIKIASAGGPRFQVLTLGDEPHALLVLDNSKWPTLSAVKEA